MNAQTRKELDKFLTQHDKTILKDTIPARKRDVLIIKIVDWSDDRADCEPAIDVEVYKNGKFDPAKSGVFPIQKKSHEGQTKQEAFKSACNVALKAIHEVTL